MLAGVCARVADMHVASEPSYRPWHDKKNTEKYDVSRLYPENNRGHILNKSIKKWFQVARKVTRSG